MAGSAHPIRMSSIASFFTEEPGILLKGENAIESKHIKTMVFDGDLLIIRGSVWASQRSKCYDVEIHLDNELSLQQASCTCPRGQYLCHHMAALALYAHYNVSSTDITCRWSERKSKVDEVVTIQELYPLSEAKKDFKATGREVTSEDAAWFYEALNTYDGAVGFTWLLKPEVFDEEMIVPDVEEIIFSEAYLSSENQREYLSSLLEINLEKVKEIAAATTGQTKNVKWLQSRKHRLTASTFGRILAAIRRKSYPPSLFRTLTESYDLEGVKAIQWERSNEEAAVQTFEAVKKIHTQDSGLWLHICGYLGASPDRLIGEDCILEVKCPYKYRNSSSLIEDISKEKHNIIKSEAGKVVVNVEHDYYHQIQAQLHFTERKVAYLMIWVPNDHIIVEIGKDPTWGRNIQLLQDFYFNVYLKYICGLLDE